MVAGINFLLDAKSLKALYLTCILIFSTSYLSAADFLGEEALKQAVLTRYASALDVKRDILRDYSGAPGSGGIMLEGSNFNPKSVDALDYRLHNFRTKLNDDQDITELEPIFVGSSCLNNHTDYNQSLTTTEFSKTIANTVSTTTTNGWTISDTVEMGGIVIPFKMILSGSINISKAEAITDTITQTYTAKAQTVFVPPHSTAEVTALLSMQKVSGSYDFFKELSGDAKVIAAFDWNSIHFVGLTTVSIFDVLQYGSGVIDPHIGLDPQTSKVLLKGTGKYEAKVGLTYLIDTKIASNESENTQIGNEPSKISHSHPSYSYLNRTVVEPQISAAKSSIEQQPLENAPLNKRCFDIF